MNGTTNETFLFMTFYCGFFIFPSPSTHLPKRFISVPPTSMLQASFPRIFLLPISSMAAHPSHSPVPLPFTQRYLQILMSSESLFLSLVPLSFLSSCPTAKSLALYFNTVILAHQTVVFNGGICWFGTTYLFFGQINAVKLWIRLSTITFK